MTRGHTLENLRPIFTQAATTLSKTAITESKKNSETGNQ
jgi:hypothetical protein